MRSLYIDRNYEMNPEQEELLENGMKLRNGMIVLIGDPEQRVDINSLVNEEAWREKVLWWHNGTPPWMVMDETKRRQAIEEQIADNAERDRVQLALQFNRWCMVTQVDVMAYRGFREHHDHVLFIGVYSDGTEFKHFIDVSTPWIVKKNTNIKPAE